MSRAFIHRPFDGHLAIKPTGILLARPHGTTGFTNAGNYESVDYTLAQEEEDVWSPQTPERSKVGVIYGEQSIDLSIGLRQLNGLWRSVAVQSRPDLVIDQAAAQAQEFLIPNAKAGTVYRLPHRNITSWTAEGAAQVDLVDEVNVQLDNATGHFEVIGFPGAEAGDPLLETGTVKILYDAGAITGERKLGFFSAQDARFELMFRGTSRYGPMELTELWNVQLRGDGAQTIGANSNEQQVRNFVGKAFADPSKPDEFKYGQVTDIPRRLAA